MEHDVVDGLTFTEFKEVKHSSGNKKYLKFYLVATDGSEHLAAVGEDLGDAHYHYKTTKPFNQYGVVDGHQRKDLLQWLEQVIRESQGSAAQEPSMVEATPSGPQALYFTGHRHARDYCDDGRRLNKWYLIDQHGNEHLAVLGEERDTRDGHYTYRAEEPFGSTHPLNCSNQTGVFHWLEQMLTHHAAAAGIPPETILANVVQISSVTRGGHSARRGDDGDRASRLLILEPGSSRRSARAAAEKEGGLAASSSSRGRGRGRKSGVKHKTHTGIVEQMQLKRMRKLQEEAENEQANLQAAFVAKLRRRAVAEAARRDNARTATYTWLKAAPTSDEMQMLQHWHEVLKSLQAEEQRQPKRASSIQQRQGRGRHTPAAAAAAQTQQQSEAAQQQQQQQQQQKHGVRVALEALKELGALFVPMAALLGSGVIDTVRAFKAHTHPDVASAAGRVLAHWLLQLASHVAVLDDGDYMQDPVSELEAQLAAGQVQLPTLPPKANSSPGLKGAHTGQLTPAGAALSTPFPSRGGASTPAPAAGSAAAALAEAGAFLAPMSSSAGPSGSAAYVAAQGGGFLGFGSTGMDPGMALLAATPGLHATPGLQYALLQQAAQGVQLEQALQNAQGLQGLQAGPGMQLPTGQAAQGLQVGGALHSLQGLQAPLELQAQPGQPAAGVHSAPMSQAAPGQQGAHAGGPNARATAEAAALLAGLSAPAPTLTMAQAGSALQLGALLDAAGAASRAGLTSSGPGSLLNGFGGFGSPLPQLGLSPVPAGQPPGSSNGLFAFGSSLAAAGGAAGPGDTGQPPQQQQ